MTPELTTALLAGASGLVMALAAFVNGWRTKRDRNDETDDKRLKLYDSWAPKVDRWAVAVQRLWAKHAPDGVELPDYPELPEVPAEPKPRRART